MKLALEKPYSDDWDYGYLVKNKEDRKQVCLYVKDGEKRTTTPFARYLMSVEIGRYLRDDEHVDHIDEDKTNDSVDNLQILTPLENSKKYFLLKGKRAKKVVLSCPQCQEDFMLTERHYKSRIKNNKRIFCSKNCSLLFYNPNGFAGKTVGVDKIKEIKWLREKGGSSYSIARELGIARNTVMKYW